MSPVSGPHATGHSGRLPVRVMLMSGRQPRRSGGLPEIADDPARRAPVAIVERDGQAITVKPPCEAVLKRLKTAIHVAAVEPRLGFLTVPWPVALSEVEDMP